MKTKRFLTVVALLLSVIVMGSCGGGGGDKESTGTIPQPQTGEPTPQMPQGNLSDYSAGNVEDPSYNGTGIDEDAGLSTSNLAIHSAASESCGPMGSGYGSYYPYNCTEWAAVRRCQKGDPGVIWQRNLLPVNSRNGRYWLDYAQASGYETGPVPKSGAVAVFWLSSDPCPGSPSCKNKDLYKYGHVAYVESKSDTQWCISEYNYRYPLSYGERCFSQNNKAPALIGFIYGSRTPPEIKKNIVSGRITFFGAGLSGIKVYLTGTDYSETNTDSNGYYTFSAPNGSYTITPKHADYTFSPASRSITISNENITGQDFFATRQLTLSISRGGPSECWISGSKVTSSPPSIDCGITCAAKFDYGTVVTLTATPSSNCSFSMWDGACTGLGPCTVTMDTDKTVRATFTVSNEGILSVTPFDFLNSSGPQGGPFSPSSITYTLTNVGGFSVNWTASVFSGSNWISLSATSGILSPSQSTTVTVSINSNANTLASGNYTDTVQFINVTNHYGDQPFMTSLWVQ